MQAIAVGNSPLEAGSKTEYGIVLISMIDTNKGFPTGKTILEYNDSIVKSTTCVPLESARNLGQGMTAYS